MMVLDCPAHLTKTTPHDAGLPAEVRGWFTVSSSNGPLKTPSPDAHPATSLVS